MSDRLTRRLEAIAADYAAVQGTPFQQFYCPILFRDEDVELCEAHIVNKAFGVSGLATVERKDVDGFYGSHFESDFLDLKSRHHTPAEILSSPSLVRRFRPQVLADGHPVDYYLTDGPIPPQHTRVLLEGSDSGPAYALKIPPDEAAALDSAHWTVAIEKDLRLPALVSLLKAAHLTLFRMLGYSYALSAGGHFLGYDVLGRFFLKNRDRSRGEILKDARSHFAEFARLMRPMLGVPDAFRGTVHEGALYLCERGSIRWGMLVMVRTGPGPLHSVLVPNLEQPIAAEIFMRFLRNSEEEAFAARVAWFRGDHWEVAKEPITARWPKDDMTELAATASVRRRTP
jgi:hypothetical protein